MMKFLILEQKYLECIEEERNGDALKCLQTEIKPLNYKKEKLPTICRFVFDEEIVFSLPYLIMTNLFSLS